MTAENTVTGKLVAGMHPTAHERIGRQNIVIVSKLTK